MTPSKLQKIRTKTGLSKKDFAPNLGSNSRETVTMIETGLREPTKPQRIIYWFIERFGLPKLGDK